MRVALGHSKPALQPVLWDAPSGFYEGKDDPQRFRCPRLAVTTWAHGVLDLYLAAVEFSAPPGPDARLWPSKLATALAVLRGEFLRKKHADVEKAQRKADLERQQQAYVAAKRRG